MNNRIIQGDCLEVMKTLPNKSIDLVLTDPPYGITNNNWDTVVDFMDQAFRVSDLVIVTASQPYSSVLVYENRQKFKHEWIWIKNRGSNFANTVREPMKEHEHILVFAEKKWTYNPQMQERIGGGLERTNYLVEHNNQKREGTRVFEGRPSHVISKKRTPSSWQKFNVEVGLHPTQKPVKLFSYLIKTYTNDGDIVLDPFIGSGTTAVAARNLGRKYLGIELNPEYIRIAEQRLAQQSLE